jgi:septum site-determining protein MinC
MSLVAASELKVGGGGKRRRISAGRPRAPARDGDLRALTKAELIALVNELRAQNPVHDKDANETDDAVPPASLFVTQSVRSGQTIEFPQGDVVVIGSVGSGAEIVAGGSIHVYGTLRGRAVAGTPGNPGARGNPAARIFCQNLQAELLVIDGRYRRGENLDPSLWGRPVQARLEGMGMTLAPLD